MLLLLLLKPSSEGHLKDANTVSRCSTLADPFLFTHIFLLTSGLACPRLSWPPAWLWRAPYSRATNTEGVSQRLKAPGWPESADWRVGTRPPPARPRPPPRRAHRTASSRLEGGEAGEVTGVCRSEIMRAIVHVPAPVFTCVVGTVFSAALVDDQTSLEELEEARRLFSLSHQHLKSQSDTL